MFCVTRCSKKEKEKSRNESILIHLDHKHIVAFFFFFLSPDDLEQSTRIASIQRTRPDEKKKNNNVKQNTFRGRSFEKYAFVLISQDFDQSDLSVDIETIINIILPYPNLVIKCSSDIVSMSLMSTSVDNKIQRMIIFIRFFLQLFIINHDSSYK